MVQPLAQRPNPAGAAPFPQRTGVKPSRAAREVASDPWPAIISVAFTLGPTQNKERPSRKGALHPICGLQTRKASPQGLPANTRHIAPKRNLL